jgi:hypothetical protein
MGKYTAEVKDHLVLPATVRLLPGQERAMASRGESVPAPVSIRLLIDTGAKRTTLIPGLIRHLQPTPGHEVQLITPTEEVATGLFWVCLELPNAGLAPFTEILVVRHPMPPRMTDFHGLFGRDLLGRWDSLLYEGRRGRYTLRDTPGWLGWLRRWL